MALGVVRQALRMNVRVPEDLSVVGFDDSPAAMFSPVPLTTLRPQRKEIIRTAFDLLKDRIDGKQPKKEVKKYLDPELVVRASTTKNGGGA
jgi:LacI family transcriptional regulator